MLSFLILQTIGSFHRVVPTSSALWPSLCFPRAGPSIQRPPPWLFKSFLESNCGSLHLPAKKRGKKSAHPVLPSDACHSAPGLDDEFSRTLSARLFLLPKMRDETTLGTPEFSSRRRRGARTSVSDSAAPWGLNILAMTSSTVCALRGWRQTQKKRHTWPTAPEMRKWATLENFLDRSQPPILFHERPQTYAMWPIPQRKRTENTHLYYSDGSQTST